MLKAEHREMIRGISESITKVKTADTRDYYFSNSSNSGLTPSYDKLKDSTLEKILKLGFSKIEIVSPKQANCIIRVYKKVDSAYDNNCKCDVFGVNCYTRKNGMWFTKDSQGNEFKICYSKCIRRVNICSDKYIDFDCDFFDTYCKIS